MENNNHAPITTMILTILTTILGWITLLDAQYVMSFVLTCIGIISGVMAIRYYYHAGNSAKSKK